MYISFYDSPCRILIIYFYTKNAFFGFKHYTRCRCISGGLFNVIKLKYFDAEQAIKLKRKGRKMLEMNSAVNLWTQSFAFLGFLEEFFGKKVFCLKYERKWK